MMPNLGHPPRQGLETNVQTYQAYFQQESDLNGGSQQFPGNQWQNSGMRAIEEQKVSFY